jgi:hypothetical protein
LANDYCILWRSLDQDESFLFFAVFGNTRVKLLLTDYLSGVYTMPALKKT